MLDPALSLTDLVLRHSACAAVLQRHRLDFCCHGGRTLQAAAAERGLDVEVVRRELEAAIAETPVGEDLRAVPTPVLLAKLVQEHHLPVRQALPTVRGLAAKVHRVHGAHDSRLPAVRQHVEALAEELLAHFEEEERAVFPALASENPAGARRFLDELTREHEALSRELHQLRAATEDYAVPSWACTSYRTLFAELRRLEASLVAILHLEHNVLRPRLEAL